MEVGIRIGAGLLPALDTVFRVGTEDNRMLLGAVLRLGVRTHALHVVTSDVMLRAVAAGHAKSASCSLSEERVHIPLRKVLVTANVPPLARFAAFTALRVAPSGGSCTLASHCNSKLPCCDNGWD